MSLILYTGAFRFPAGDAAAARVLNNARLLRELGHEVKFLSWGGEPREIDLVDGTHYYDGFPYVNTQDLRSSRLSPLKRICNFFFMGRKSLRMIKCLENKPDIIITYNSPLFFSIRLMAYCKRQKITLINDITEWYAPSEHPGGIFAPPAWCNEINMRIIQQFVKNKIVISSFLNSYYSQSNNLMLPPLVDETEVKWLTPSCRKHEGKTIKLIYAGTPAKKDLLEMMLEAVLAALEKNADIQFYVLGVTQNDIAHYSNIARIGQHSDRIMLLGRVPQEEVPTFYATADFSLLIRKDDRKSRAGFPTKFVESMMCGCPVICNITSDIADYIQNEYTGFIIESNSVERLEKTLIELSLLSRAQIDTMKHQAKQFALERFCYRSHVAAMQSFLTNSTH